MTTVIRKNDRYRHWYDINLHCLTLQETDAQMSESKTEAMEQGTSQDENSTENDENMENEVNYTFY